MYEQLDQTSQQDHRSKKVEDSPIWELTRYGDVNSLHETAVELAEKIADEVDPNAKEELRADYKKHLEALNESLLASIDNLRENLDFQEEHDLIKHKWGIGLEPFSEALAKGTRTIEMDIRATLDSEPVIAHSMKIGGTKVHEARFEDLMQTKDATSLRQIFEQFSPYSADHELVLELKDVAAVDRAIELVKEFHLEQCVRFASLSPAILEAVKMKMPEVKGLILNGGVVPFITTPIEESPNKSNLEKFVVKDGEGWKAANVGPVQVVFGADSFPTSDEATRRVEGVGKYLGYAFFRIPERLKEMLDGDKDAISLSAVLIASNIISIFSAKTGKEMMQSYKAMAEKMGLKTMATTWMESMGGVISPLRADQQFKMLKELGVETIYTADPVDLAEEIRDQSEIK